MRLDVRESYAVKVALPAPHFNRSTVLREERGSDAPDLPES
ncbi:MAG: hypothetical protein R3E32_28215 [Chitinophagales bacterium]